MAAAELATLGALIADPTRAELLCALMDGRAHTGGELAGHLGVGASTVSEHLSKLLDASLVTVEAQGRHRYFRLADSETAELLELLGAVSTPITPKPSRTAARLTSARSCYDHLAGELAIDIYDRLTDAGHLDADGDHLVLTDSGSTFLTDIGVDVEAAKASQRPTVRSCLDWTQRRHHLAGALGAELFATMLGQGWLRHGRQPRSIEVTKQGAPEIARHFTH